MTNLSFRAKPACLALAMLLGGLAAGAQSYPAVPANLESQVPTSGHILASKMSLEAVPEDFGNVRFAPGFQVQMDVFQIPDMDATLRVDERGALNIPLLGAVPVGGLTIAEAQAAVEKAYVDARILKSPQITLTVTQYSTVNTSVLGEVQQPGRVPLLGPKSLTAVLALVGGETAAAGDEIDITSKATGQARSVEFAQGSDPEKLRDVIVQPGDTVFVRRAATVYVLGAVTRPGGYLMVHGGRLNVLEAISLAYGTTNVAKSNDLRIVRPSADGKYAEIEVPYKDMTEGRVQPVWLQANDILYVPTSGVKSVLINGSGIISTAASAAIYKF